MTDPLFSIQPTESQDVDPQRHGLASRSNDSAAKAKLLGIGPLLPLLKDQLGGVDMGDGWIKYGRPHKKYSSYFYHFELKLVTAKDDMDLPADRDKFLSKYRDGACRNHPAETYIPADSKRDAAVVNHEMESLIFVGDEEYCSAEKSRGDYWKYMHTFPCHHKLSSHAEPEALNILRLMIVQSITNADGAPCTPLSMQDIQQYIDFFNFSKTHCPSESPEDVPLAKDIAVTGILANYYSYSKHTDGKSTAMPMPSKSALTVACWGGMSPNYLQRFHSAYSNFERTLQPASWKLFLDQVRKERAATNVVSGLLLASSVAFLAIPNLVDVAQFFIIISIGLSLGCVVMGFNGGVDNTLSELEHISAQPEVDTRLPKMAHAMEQQYAILLLSVLCFFLSLFAFTAYSIYSSVFVAKFFTVRYLFFVMATAGLVFIMGIILRWNWRFL